MSYSTKEAFEQIKDWILIWNDTTPTPNPMEVFENIVSMCDMQLENLQ